MSRDLSVLMIEFTIEFPINCFFPHFLSLLFEILIDCR